jgi:hypothetical protein
LVEVLKSLIREIKYKDELAKLYPNANDQESRWASVEEVVNALADYSRRESDNGHRATVAGFLHEVDRPLRRIFAPNGQHRAEERDHR